MAFDMGGFGQGAAGGAMMGAQTGNPYIAAGGGLIGGLMGAFGGGSKKGGTEIREFKPQWYQNPGSQGAYNSAWGNLQNQQEALSRGELPSYFQRYQQSARKQLSDPLARMYFGSNGSQGLLNRNFEAASMAGAGPKAGVAAMRKGLNDYAQQSQQIDFLMNQLGYDQFTAAQNQSMPITQNSGSWKMSDYLPITTPPQQGVGSQLLGMGMQSGGIGSLSGMFSGMGGGGSMGMPPALMGNNSGAGFGSGMSKVNFGSGVNVPPQYR